MAKRLIELLVVEGQLKDQAKERRAELRKTFESKRHLFEEKITSVHPVAEGEQPRVESQKEIQTTVVQELDWYITEIWTKALDTSLRVAEGNTIARADLVLEDGSTLVPSLPATALLELEKRATELIELLRAVPTLDPTKGFAPDPSHRVPNVFKARDERKERTKKVIKYNVIVPATEQHPAQVAQTSEDVLNAIAYEQEWSGLITPARKSVLLGRAEELLRAIRAAIQRANVTEVDADRTLANKLFGFVFAS